MEPTQTPMSAPKKGKGGLILTILVIIIIAAVVIWWTKKDSSSGEPLSTTSLAAPYATASSTFSIQFPEGWKVDDAGQFGALVFAVSSVVEGSDDTRFNSNINVTAEEVSNVTLDEYVDATLKALPQFLGNYKSTEDKAVTVDGMPARMIGGTFTQGKLDLQNIQLITMKDGKAYVVTATSLESAWDKYEDLLESSVMTFKTK